MSVTTETAGVAGVVENDVNKAESAGVADVEKAAGQVEKAGASGVADVEKAGETVESDVAAFLKSIEADALALLKKIEAIPAGVQHAWHTLGAEIAARKL